MALVWEITVHVPDFKMEEWADSVEEALEKARKFIVSELSFQDVTFELRNPVPYLLDVEED